MADVSQFEEGRKRASLMRIPFAMKKIIIIVKQSSGVCVCGSCALFMYTNEITYCHIHTIDCTHESIIFTCASGSPKSNFNAYESILTAWVVYAIGKNCQITYKNKYKIWQGITEMVETACIIYAWTKKW